MENLLFCCVIHFHSLCTTQNCMSFVRYGKWKWKYPMTNCVWCYDVMTIILKLHTSSIENWDAVLLVGILLHCSRNIWSFHFIHPFRLVNTSNFEQKNENCKFFRGSLVHHLWSWIQPRNWWVAFTLKQFTVFPFRPILVSKIISQLYFLLNLWHIHWRILKCATCYQPSCGRKCSRYDHYLKYFLRMSIK